MKPVSVKVAQSQSSFTLETYQGVVTQTYNDKATGNVTHCDVKLVGTNTEILRRVPNTTTNRWFVGSPVTVNFVRGQKTDPQINAGGGAGGMVPIGAALDAALNGSNAYLDTIATDAKTIPAPVLTTAYDDSTPNCFIVSPGANVVFFETPGYQYSEDETIANSLEIAVQIPLYLTLPNPAMTTLPDGSLARTRVSDIQNDLWLLDRTHGHWISLGSVGSSSSNSGVNILGSLPMPQSYMQGDLFLVSNYGTDDIFYICRELSDSSFEMAQIVTANIASPTVGQTLVFDSIGRLYNADISGGSSWYRWPIDVPPTSPNALDDEFATNTLDASWTIYTADVTKTLRTATSNSYGSGYLVLDSPYIGATDRFYGVLKDISSIGSSPFTVTAKMTLDNVSKSYTGPMLAIQAPSSGNIFLWGLIYNASGDGLGLVFDAQRLNGSYVHNGEPFHTFDASVDSANMYLRIYFDGTNYNCYYSATGLFGPSSFMYAEPASSWIGTTIDRAGLIIYPYGNYSRSLFDWIRFEV